MAKSGNPKWCRSESLRKGLTVWEQMLLRVSVWVCTGSHLYRGLGCESLCPQWLCQCQRTTEVTAPGDNKGTAAAVIIGVAPRSALLHIFVILENISFLKNIFFSIWLHQVVVWACGTFFFFKLRHANSSSQHAGSSSLIRDGNPGPPAWEAPSLSHGPPKKPPGEDFS